MKLRRLAIVAAALLFLAGGALFWAYRASQHVPEFYAQAIRAEPAEQRQASEAMLEKAAALASQARQEGTWKALFTEDQINGWAAVDLVKNHPGLLPSSAADPRVKITAEEVLVACKVTDKKLSTVMSIALEPYMAEENVIAVRIKGAHAGAVPLPLSKVLDAITKAAEKAELALSWKQTEGDPVALITLPPTRDDENIVYQLETLELRESSIFVSGRTSRADTGNKGPKPATGPVAAFQSAVKAKLQR